MALTTYSIHRAYDHSVVVTASGINLQTRAQALTEDAANHGKRFYVHNGKGVVAAMLVKPHGAFDLLRDDYLQFNQKARDLRAALGLAND
ncbi:hypothetical protein [Roseovarius mucosus]|uniref:hypothetical protein n=1 Tax=Roseovarius mucosus TaxID=215743 RepID=UPI003BAC64DE